MGQVTTTTLYFINGRVPTAEDIARAAGIPGIVGFRNIRELGDSIEAADQVTAADGVSIPAVYTVAAGYARVSPEKPLSLLIVPDAPTIDLSAAEPLRLRAIAKWRDGTQTDVTEACAWLSGTPGTATVSTSTNTKGNVAPVGVGTTLVTATFPFAGPGEVGAVSASAELNFTGVPAVDGTFTFGNVVFTWKDAPAATGSATAVQVKRGATAAECCENAANAVNGGPGSGVTYSSDRPAAALALIGRAILNPDDHTKLTLQADEIGTGGNSTAVAENSSATNFTGSVTALAGGANATGGVADTCTVTVVA